MNAMIVNSRIPVSFVFLSVIEYCKFTFIVTEFVLSLYFSKLSRLKYYKQKYVNRNIQVMCEGCNDMRDDFVRYENVYL